MSVSDEQSINVELTYLHSKTVRSLTSENLTSAHYQTLYKIAVTWHTENFTLLSLSGTGQHLDVVKKMFYAAIAVIHSA